MTSGQSMEHPSALDSTWEGLSKDDSQRAFAPPPSSLRLRRAALPRNHAASLPRGGILSGHCCDSVTYLRRSIHLPGALCEHFSPPSLLPHASDLLRSLPTSRTPWTPVASFRQRSKCTVACERVAVLQQWCSKAVGRIRLAPRSVGMTARRAAKIGALLRSTMRAPARARIRPSVAFARRRRIRFVTGSSLSAAAASLSLSSSPSSALPRREWRASAWRSSSAVPLRPCWESVRRSCFARSQRCSTSPSFTKPYGRT